MSRFSFVILALAALGCTTQQQNSALVITTVIAPQVSTTNGTTGCVLDPATKELVYMLYNPAENQGLVGAVVHNFMPSNANSVTFRLDTSTFLPHQAVIDYEVLTSNPPAIGRQVTPVAAAVKAGDISPLGVLMFPRPADFASLAAGTFVRTIFHIEGKMIDGSSARTNEREYLFQICTSAGCAGNPCF